MQLRGGVPVSWPTHIKGMRKGGWGKEKSVEKDWQCHRGRRGTQGRGKARNERFLK